MYYSVADLKSETLKGLKDLLAENPTKYNGYEVHKVKKGFHYLAGFVDFVYHPITNKYSVHITASRKTLPNL